MKSRFLELYPQHGCQECGMEHYVFPHLHEDKNVWIPFEIIGTIDGPLPEELIGTTRIPASITGLRWGYPGSKEVKVQSTIFHN